MMQYPDSHVTFTFFLPTSSSYKLPVLFSDLSTCEVPKSKVPFEKKVIFWVSFPTRSGIEGQVRSHSKASVFDELGEFKTKK